MRSKNKKSPTVDEGKYLAAVALLPCSVCDTGGGHAAPSEIHEIVQGAWWLAIALCSSCHRGPVLGLHGQKRMWAVKKLDELGALAITIQRMFSRRATR